MTGTRDKALTMSLAALLALGGLLAGCGDDDGDGGDVDAGGGTDAGGMTDTGTPDEDAGCTPMCTDRECGDDGCGGSCGTCPGGLECTEDGECPNTTFTRLAHLIPNAPAVDVCVYVYSGETLITTQGPILEGASRPDGIPFRGVTPFVGLIDAVDGVDYTVKVYAETDASTECPAADATDPVPLIEQTIGGGDLEVGAYYTIAAVGLADIGGSDPEFCGPDTMEHSPGTGPCDAEDQQPHIELYPEEVTVDTAGNTKLNFLHTVPNLGPIDICYDDDPEDDTDPVVLFDDVAYPSQSDYVDREAITAGVITLHLNLPGVDTPCPDITVDIGGTSVDTQIAAIPIPYPEATGVGSDAIPGSVAQFDADTVATMFATGIVGAAPATMMNVAVIPYANNPVTP